MSASSDRITRGDAPLGQPSSSVCTRVRAWTSSASNSGMRSSLRRNAQRQQPRGDRGAERRRPAAAFRRLTRCRPATWSIATTAADIAAAATPTFTRVTARWRLPIPPSCRRSRTTHSAAVHQCGDRRREREPPEPHHAHEHQAQHHVDRHRDDAQRHRHAAASERVEHRRRDPAWSSSRPVRAHTDAARRRSPRCRPA